MRGRDPEKTKSFSIVGFQTQRPWKICKSENNNLQDVRSSDTSGRDQIRKRHLESFEYTKRDLGRKITFVKALEFIKASIAIRQKRPISSWELVELTKTRYPELSDYHTYLSIRMVLQELLEQGKIIISNQSLDHKTQMTIPENFSIKKKFWNNDEFEQSLTDAGTWRDGIIVEPHGRVKAFKAVSTIEY